MEKKKQANFQRTKYYAFVKLGLRQKSKRRYVRARGRHNKIRQKWRGKPPMVEAGYKNKVETRGLINGKMPVLVYNVSDLAKVGKDNIAIIAKVGDRNKLEIAKEALAKKVEIYNLNIRKFMKKIERENKYKKIEPSKHEKSK
jgi:large subunit ribosomal protein L32e